MAHLSPTTRTDIPSPLCHNVFLILVIPWATILPSLINWSLTHPSPLFPVLGASLVCLSKPLPHLYLTCPVSQPLRYSFRVSSALHLILYVTKASQSRDPAWVRSSCPHSIWSFGGSGWPSVLLQGKGYTWESQKREEKEPSPPLWHPSFSLRSRLDRQISEAKEGRTQA